MPCCFPSSTAYRTKQKQKQEIEKLHKNDNNNKNIQDCDPFEKRIRNTLLIQRQRKNEVHILEKMKSKIPFCLFQDMLLIRERISISLLLSKMKILR